MGWSSEQLLRRRVLADLSALHPQRTAGDHAHHTEVVTHEDDCGAVSRRELGDQVDDRGLNRDVERRRTPNCGETLAT